MRLFAVLFFSLLAFDRKSFATDEQCTANQTVDLDLIADDYENFIETLPVPTLSLGDEATAQFTAMYTKNVKVWARSLIYIVYTEAQDAGDQLIKDIEKVICDLEEKIKSLSHHYEPYCLDEALKKVNDQLDTFLDLDPGNATANFGPFPALPVQDVPVIPVTTKHTAKESIQKFGVTIDSIAAQGYAYLSSLYLQGWKFTRRDYATNQVQIYNEILDGPVLDAYRKAVDKVFHQKEVIRDKVAPETWKHFEHDGHIIVEIADRCKHRTYDPRYFEKYFYD